MKKLFTVSVLAMAASAAFAQSSVTVYGIADVGATRVSGMKGGAVKLLSSGIMDGSRLGFRGNEDLGGGYRALFTLEHRLELDTGGVSNRPPSGSQLPDRVSIAARLGLPATLPPGIPSQTVVNNVLPGIGSTIGVNLTNNFWDRQAFAGLVTPYGAVLAGRQYTPAYEASVAFDTLGTQSALAFGQVASIPASIDIRVSNALEYRIQAGGFSAAAMAAAAEGSTTTGRLLGAMAIYKGEYYSFGFGYNTRKNEKAAKSLTSTVVGGSVNVGPGTAFVQYVKVMDDNPTGLSSIAGSLAPSIGAANAATVANAFINGFKQDAAAFHVGYRTILGANTIYVAYSKLNDKRPANADTSSYGVTYSYALSKRTDINASVVRFVNSDNAQAAPGGTGYLGGVTSAAGIDSSVVALGIRHRF